MNVNSEQADVYEREVVDDGYPITGIHIEEEGKIEYIMSSTKVSEESVLLKFIKHNFVLLITQVRMLYV